MPPRLAVIASHPIQYQAPLFRLLASRGVVEPEVFFLDDHGLAESFDVDFARSIRYDVPLTDGYAHRFVANRAPRPSVHHPLGQWNPDLFPELDPARFDAVLIHGYATPSTFAAHLVARSRRLPYLLRGETQAPLPVSRSSLRWRVKASVLGPLVRGAGACTVIGRRNAGFYAALGAPASKLVWAPYSVDNGFFAERGAKGRAGRDDRLVTLGLDPSLPVVLFAAKLVGRKRPVDLLDATRHLTSAVSVVIIGDGPLRTEVEAAARGRSDVRLLGFVNQQELAEWYGVADLFVLCSDYETWGLAVNEAMAAGAVPIVSDAAGCADDLVVDGAGRVVATADVDALAAAIEELLDPQVRTRAQAEVARRIGRYGLEATAAGIERATMIALGALDA